MCLCVFLSVVDVDKSHIMTKYLFLYLYIKFVIEFDRSFSFARFLSPSIGYYKYYKNLLIAFKERSKGVRWVSGGKGFQLLMVSG